MKGKKVPRKVTCKTSEEFIEEVAKDCLANLREKDKEYLRENPRAIMYHFTYCMYIRNHYIHGRDFSEVDYWYDPDDMSSTILHKLLSYLLPEYEYRNFFIEILYDDKRFIKLRKEYRRIYGEYPADMVRRYQQNMPEEADYTYQRQVMEELIKELAEQVWQTEDLIELAAECGIPYRWIAGRVERIKRLLFEQEEYLPLQICLLPYKKQIGNERYLVIRRELGRFLDKEPHLAKYLDAVYFKDRVLAKKALKWGWTLKYLPMYKDDEVMVKYALTRNGTALQYAAKRFWQDPEWVKFAIEHSAKDTILAEKCMKPYRRQKEFVYLACRVHRWNFVFADKSFRDDRELAMLCMEQRGDHNAVFFSFSKRLRADKELALLDLQEDYPHVEYYAPALKNDDEIGAELLRLHGEKSFGWYHMSKRVRKKYHIVLD